ncbi:MAG: hypothetical protein V7K32_12970 [Nostoc sp.]|uniref:hypothetical protein n=1 Tax=Nostoc sp. TaxID=1180 RepID=UPI002FFB49E7
MSETINIEQAVLDNLRILSNDKQQEVLDFVEVLVKKTVNHQQLDIEDSDSSISSNLQQEQRLWQSYLSCEKKI